MPHILIEFSSAATADRRVAGIPAAARAAHAIALLHRNEHGQRCVIAAGRGWMPSAATIAECRRLAPYLRLTFSAEPWPGDVLIARGETFVAAVARRQCDGVGNVVLPALLNARMKQAASPHGKARGVRDLRRAEHDILAATGKSGDGVISRYVNRPVSRAISRQLLKVPGLTPTHASLFTAALGLMMSLALLLGGNVGLIAGALLFQAASIFDGVDGEMARATYRTSMHGATLDSVIDACTNLAFIAGVTVNIALSGDVSGATAGTIALVTLAIGLLRIGRRADAAGEATNFDLVKRHFRKRGRRSVIIECLIQMTMRDFFAAACAVMVVTGMTHWLLLAFATISAGWLAVTTIVLAQTGGVASEADRREFAGVITLQADAS